MYNNNNDDILLTPPLLDKDSKIDKKTNNKNNKLKNKHTSSPHNFETPPKNVNINKSIVSPNFVSPTSKLFNYVRAKDINSIDIFMKEGGDLNMKSYYGTTCLHLAVQEGNNKLVKYLIEKDCDPNIQEGVENRTPSHLAASYGHTECLRILLSKNVNINQKDSKGQTPLIKACRHSHFDCIQLILDCNGNVHEKDSERGYTPLHHSCSSGELNCCKLLLSSGCKIDEVDNYGRSPLFIATFKNKIDIIKLLLENDADFKLKNSEGVSPYDISRSNREISNLFKKKNKQNKLKKLKETPIKEWVSSQVLDWIRLTSFPKNVLSSFKKMNTNGNFLLNIDDEYLKNNMKLLNMQERNEFIKKRNYLVNDHSESFSCFKFMEIDYKEIKFCGHLGKGNFAEVKKATYKGSDVAVKIIYRNAFRNKDKFQLFKQEVSILSQLEHPNILKFLGTCTTTEDSNYCIITEFMGGGNLRSLINENFKCLNVKGLRRQIIKNIINAMNYLHSFKPLPILHRDLTSHNLLLDKNRVCKLADFGLSRLRDDEHTMTGSVGNLPWICPEVIMGKAYDEKADVFSFGVCLYELFSGKLPHTGFYAIKYAEMVSSGYRPSIENIVDPWKHIISICWSQKSDERPYFSELIVLVDNIKTFFDNVRDEKSDDFSVSFSNTSQDVSQFDLPEDLIDNFSPNGYISEEE